MDNLSLNGIPYIHVSYEKLYHSESAEEWMRIFRFLGRGPGHGLTMQTVRESFSIAATTTAKRNDKIANFKDVEESLRNAKYEGEFEHFLDNWTKKEIGLERFGCTILSESREYVYKFNSNSALWLLPVQNILLSKG